MASISPGALSRDPERPAFHVMSKQGWINDPNGPVYSDGYYHIFYQYVPHSCEWDFGIEWGHAISSDLVHWQHLPPAIAPTRGGADADGCFSGCCVRDADGTPTILYTGVRLRSNPDCAPPPPSNHDLKLNFIESQLAAQPASGDRKLEKWNKAAAPLIELPPENMPLVGWRDPFILQAGGNGQEWIMLMGCGLEGRGGAAMVYRADRLLGEWQHTGMLCEAETHRTGAMWECPLLVELPQLPAALKQRGLDLKEHHRHPMTAHRLAARRARLSLDGPDPKSAEPYEHPESADAAALAGHPKEAQAGAAVAEGTAPGMDSGSSSSSSDDGDESPPPPPARTHFFCVSPDAPTNAVLYWLGGFDAAHTKFLLEEAAGPKRLDLGDVLYAPNLQQDAQGRCVMWGWLQERRKPGSYDYAGCMTVPRLLYVEDERLIQIPVPEITQLRSAQTAFLHDVDITCDGGVPLEGPPSRALDIELVLQRGEAESAGVAFQSWSAGEGDAAVLFHFDTSRLEVIFQGVGAEHFDSSPDVPDFIQRRIGGKTQLAPGHDVYLRVLIDGSCVEVFAATGEALSTRIYRGQAPANAGSGISFVSFGGTAKLAAATAWQMDTIWRDEIAPATEAKVDTAATEEVLAANVTAAAAAATATALTNAAAAAVAAAGPAAASKAAGAEEAGRKPSQPISVPAAAAADWRQLVDVGSTDAGSRMQSPFANPRTGLAAAERAASMDSPVTAPEILVPVS